MSSLIRFTALPAVRRPSLVFNRSIFGFGKKKPAKDSAFTPLPEPTLTQVSLYPIDVLDRQFEEREQEY